MGRAHSRSCSRSHSRFGHGRDSPPPYPSPLIGRPYIDGPFTARHDMTHTQSHESSYIQTPSMAAFTNPRPAPAPPALACEPTAQHDGLFSDTAWTFGTGTNTNTNTDTGTSEKQGARRRVLVPRSSRNVLGGLCCLFSLAAAVFLVVAQAGSTSRTSANIYLFRMDLRQVFKPAAGQAGTPASAALAGAVAQSVGLPDYIQSGLWGHCQGSSGHADAMTCSRPTPFYWFDPVRVLADTVLAGSTLVVPARATAVLEVVRVASQTMFGLFFVGLLLSGGVAAASPLALVARSRWAAALAGLLAAVAAGALVAASAVATVLAVAYRVVGSVATREAGVHVSVAVGPVMFAMVWTATALMVAVVLLHGAGCCLPSANFDVQPLAPAGDGCDWRIGSTGSSNSNTGPHEAPSPSMQWLRSHVRVPCVGLVLRRRAHKRPAPPTPHTRPTRRSDEGWSSLHTWL